MIYILDACTIINLLHIDEDEFLMKKINSFEFTLSKFVFEEVNKNVFKKLAKEHPYPQDKHSEIEKKLNYFRQRVFSDEDYFDLEEDVSKLFPYTKRNGEFYSTLLSFYLNTFHSTHVLLFTDDGPAKDFFSTYFAHHRIGYIEDSIDLLILLYRHNQDFSSTSLKKIMSNLYYEYASEIKEIQDEIEKFEIPKSHIRNKELSIKLYQIRSALKSSDFDDIYRNCKDVLENPKKYEPLFTLLEKHTSYIYSKPDTNFLTKMKQNIQQIDSQPFYKFI